MWQLDGNRGFAALTRAQRWLAVAALVAAWRITGDGLLVLVILAASVRAFSHDAPSEPDRGALLQYATVTLALAVVFGITATAFQYFFSFQLPASSLAPDYDDSSALGP